ncbi:hypothetical protein QMZ05_20840 [Bradyrhizobium sp. INPA03-11B]|uniref:hypothetical protein n=1 Tax=Bradyrhizobium sp. INPA03-11B TaxID=418598 RepID=UPI00338F217A
MTWKIVMYTTLKLIAIWLLINALFFVIVSAADKSARWRRSCEEPTHMGIGIVPAGGVHHCVPS